jgi:hypothetical protein
MGVPDEEELYKNVRYGVLVQISRAYLLGAAPGALVKPYLGHFLLS